VEMAVTDKPGNPITFHSGDDMMNLILIVHFAIQFRKPKMVFKQNAKSVLFGSAFLKNGG
jgi:hypothetical protein